MKTLFKIACFVLVNNLAQAMSIVPNEVTKNFHEEYPEATHIKWKHVNQTYEAHFIVGEYEHAALFDSKGNEIKALTFIEHFHTEEVATIDSIVHYNQPDANTVIIGRYDKNTNSNSYIILYQSKKHLYEMYLDEDKHVTTIKEFIK
jgi:uncharacterized SAM-dependent methyltransferase